MLTKAIVTKTVRYWHKNRHTDKWNGIERPELKLHLYGQLVYDKRRKKHATGEGLPLNKCWKNDTATCKKIKLGFKMD